MNINLSQSKNICIIVVDKIKMLRDRFEKKNINNVY